MKILPKVCLMVWAAWLPLTGLAQTTEFTYQGELTDSGTSQATYQMRFRLFGAAAGGSPIGSTVENTSVAVDGGVFTVALNFGSAVFTGADRYLEIAVRRNAGQSYTVLDPRQKIASSPYAVRTLSAQTADVAVNAQNLGGVPANQYVTTSSVGNAFIRNGTSLQDADFNIDGNGFIGGGLGVGVGAIQPGYGLDVRGSSWISSNFSTHSVVQTQGGPNSWARFYMRTPNRSWFLGTSRNFNGDQLYIADESAPPSGQIRMAISTSGLVGINNTNPQAGLDIRGTGFQSQQRITDNTSGNSLVLQGGAGGNMKITGYNYNSSTSVPLHLSTDGANTVVGGNAVQVAGGLGLPKAMIWVNTNRLINKCYNGINGVSATNAGQTACGFTVSVVNPFETRVDFGFPVNNSFFALVVRASTSASGGVFTLGEASAIQSVNQIVVDIDEESRAFQVIVY